MARRVFITVGEASGDQHAANLIRELRALDPTIIVEGLGGPEMKQAGAIVFHDTVSGAAMLFKAVLRSVEIMRYLQWTRRHFREEPPNLQICIDSWSMNWNWAKLARQNGVPVLYYIAPQIWASRHGRIKRIAKYVDRVACILPFEEEVFRQGGVEATFVGHPLFDTLPPPRESDPAQRFPHRPPVIGLAPGSRSGVAKNNFPHLLDVARRITEVFPDATFMVPTMPSTHDVVEKILRALPPEPTAKPSQVEREGLQTFGRYTIGLGRFDELVPRCDLCISVSGTATLHIAGYGVPLIVVYRLNPIQWNLLGRWIVKTRTYSLVNLLNIGRQQIVPEFVPWYGSNAPVAAKALEYLQNPALLDEQRERLGNLIRTLHKPGASRQAAKIAIDMMEAREKTRPA